MFEIWLSCQFSFVLNVIQKMNEMQDFVVYVALKLERLVL